MLTEHDEILIQRCVDGELTSEERRDLLERMHQLPDGWKTLACSFIEDQLFAGAAIDSAVGMNQSLGAVNPAALPSRSKRSWFYHPATSVVLSLCVAFLAGLLISGEMSQPQGVAVAESVGNTERGGLDSRVLQKDAVVSGALVSNGSDYSVRLEADGMSPMEIPVFEDRAVFLDQFREHQARNAIQQKWQLTDDADSEINFLRIRMDDGRTIVFPVEGNVPHFQ